MGVISKIFSANRTRLSSRNAKVRKTTRGPFIFFESSTGRKNTFPVSVFFFYLFVVTSVFSVVRRADRVGAA